MLRDSETSFNEKLAEKLKSESLTTKDWWSTLKHFILRTLRQLFRPLNMTIANYIYTDEHDKANILNNFFRNQTILDETDATLPDQVPHVDRPQLFSIVLSPVEVESILKTLTVGKASGPNALNNRVLRENSK